MNVGELSAEKRDIISSIALAQLYGLTWFPITHIVESCPLTNLLWLFSTFWLNCSHEITTDLRVRYGNRTRTVNENTIFTTIVRACRSPLSPTFIFLSEGQQPFFPSRITLSLIWWNTYLSSVPLLQVQVPLTQQYRSNLQQYTVCISGCC